MNRDFNERNQAHFKEYGYSAYLRLRSGPGAASRTRIYDVVIEGIEEVPKPGSRFSVLNQYGHVRDITVHSVLEISDSDRFGKKRFLCSTRFEGTWTTVTPTEMTRIREERAKKSRKRGKNRAKTPA